MPFPTSLESRSSRTSKVSGNIRYRLIVSKQQPLQMTPQMTGLTDTMNAIPEGQISNQYNKKHNQNNPSNFNGIRSSRRSGGAQKANEGGASEDVMKELEDIVKSNKQSTKFLDDISDIETISNNTSVFKTKQDRKKKQQEDLAHKLQQANEGPIQNSEN